MKTVFISGASRGIGKALAQLFIKNNFFVIGTSTKGVVDFTHENLLMLQLDQTDSSSIERCARSVTDLGKKIDVLINNAAMWIEGDYEKEVDVTILRKTLEANLIGVIDLTERLIPLMNQGGHMVNVSSRQGSFGYISTIHTTSYSISKAALNMYTRALAYRLTDHITVSAIHPGYVKTDMNEGEGDLEPEEAANDIYELALRDVETGKFWFQGKEFPW
ncbi:MAG: SDR family NAD(P)-dependent oxidoreductase [Candidatus Uhrbacteria bacterium]|nr:SDR family NAD(P)-dependent oxidoreductase [Candidatus Uhrbacteria bacterium]